MNSFLTGCDKNTEWQLPWFLSNFKKFSPDPIMVADFGMTHEMRQYVKDHADYLLDAPGEGWFGKVNAMMQMKGVTHSKVCWLDTDCQVMRSPHGLFEYIEENKLAMVKDKPWSTRRPQLGDWFNSGVVGFYGSPSILHKWKTECDSGKYRGDQEALYVMMEGDPLRKITYITELPAAYNVLRLDLLDGTADPNPIIMHWTGQKGKDEIRRQMNDE